MKPDLLPVSLIAADEPFSRLLDAVQAAGCPPDSVAWLLPRLEQAIALRAVLAERARAPVQVPPETLYTSTGGVFAGSSAFVVSPVIMTADRLSDHARSPQWLSLWMAAFQALSAVPELTHHARSTAQRWQLAQEYLLLAHACATRGADAAQAVADMARNHPLAGPEARIVLELAHHFAEELHSLQAPAPAHPGWVSVHTVVWLDDGEPVARDWLMRHAEGRRILRVDWLADAQAQASVAHATGETGVNQAVADSGHDRAGPSVDTRLAPVLLEAGDPQGVAHLAAQRILAWLRADPEAPIGVAVVDRLLARRLRSVLESAQVQVDDRTGWRLSTTRLSGWLDCLLDGWMRCDWSVWLAALEPHWMPLLRGEVSRVLLQRWTHLLERDPLRLDWERLRAEAQVLANQSDDPVVRDAIRQFVAAWDTWGCHDRSVSAWAHDVLGLLERLQSLPVLQADAAGVAFLAQLRVLARSGLSECCDASLFQLVLNTQLESVRFRPEDASSPVRFMPLQSFAMQRLPRLLVLGVARRHFMPSPPGLLPPSVATELGLSDPWLKRSQALAALTDILMGRGERVLAHQRQSGDQPEPLLGWLRAWGLQVQRRTGTDWRQTPVAIRRSVERKPVHPVSVTGWPAPATLSVEAVSALAGCPLRFVLSELADLKDRQPGVVADRAAVLRGIWVHDVLDRLWKTALQPGQAITAAEVSARNDRQAWIPLLDNALQASWRSLAQPVRAILFQERLEFERSLPGLAATLAERHAAGWRVVAQEYPVDKPVVYDPAHAPITVHGRLDRLERNGGAHAIVDVKTAAPKTLKARAAQWADYPQLPLYAHMLEQACDALAYLGLRGEAPAYIGLDAASPADMADAVMARLQQALAHLFAQAQPAQPLPGAECSWCDHAGACRHRWWSPEVPPVKTAASTETGGAE